MAGAMQHHLCMPCLSFHFLFELGGAYLVAGAIHKQLSFSDVKWFDFCLLTGVYLCRPPRQYQPMQECLGWVLLQQGKLRQAEQVTEGSAQLAHEVPVA